MPRQCAMSMAAAAFVVIGRSMTTAGWARSETRNLQADCSATNRFFWIQGCLNGKVFNPLGFWPIFKIAPEPREQFLEGRPVIVERLGNQKFARIESAGYRLERFDFGTADNQWFGN